MSKTLVGDKSQVQNSVGSVLLFILKRGHVSTEIKMQQVALKPAALLPLGRGA